MGVAGAAEFYSGLQACPVAQASEKRTEMGDLKDFSDVEFIYH